MVAALVSAQGKTLRGNAEALCDARCQGARDQGPSGAGRGQDRDAELLLGACGLCHRAGRADRRLRDLRGRLPPGATPFPRTSAKSRRAARPGRGARASCSRSFWNTGSGWQADRLQPRALARHSRMCRARAAHSMAAACRRSMLQLVRGSLPASAVPPRAACRRRRPRRRTAHRRSRAAVRAARRGSGRTARRARLPLPSGRRRSAPRSAGGRRRSRRRSAGGSRCAGSPPVPSCGSPRPRTRRRSSAPRARPAGSGTGGYRAPGRSFGQACCGAEY